MKVLIIPSFYPDFLNKNIGVFFKEQVDYLNDFGLDLDVIYVEQKSLRKLNFSNIFNNHYQFKTILRKASKDYRLLGWKMPGYLGSKLWILLMEILFKRYIKINGIPDLIHAHNIFNGGIVAFNLSKKYNIPYIITEHDSAFLNTDFSIKQKNIIKNIYSNSSKIISVSNSLKAQINKIVQNIEIEVIPNVVNNLFQVSYKEIPEIKKNIEIFSPNVISMPYSSVNFYVKKFPNYSIHCWTNGMINTDDKIKIQNICDIDNVKVVLTDFQENFLK